MLQAIFYPTFWLQFWLAAMMPPPPRKRTDARKA